MINNASPPYLRDSAFGQKASRSSDKGEMTTCECRIVVTRGKPQKYSNRSPFNSRHSLFGKMGTRWKGRSEYYKGKGIKVASRELPLGTLAGENSFLFKVLLYKRHGLKILTKAFEMFPVSTEPYVGISRLLSSLGVRRFSLAFALTHRFCPCND